MCVALYYSGGGSTEAGHIYSLRRVIRLMRGLAMNFRVLGRGRGSFREFGVLWEKVRKVKWLRLIYFHWFL